MIKAISNVDAIIELLLREAHGRVKIDNSKAILEVLQDIITRCNEILNQVPFYERGINKEAKKGGER